LWTVGESRRQLSVKSGKTEAAPRRPSADLQQDQQVVLWGRSRDQLHHRIYSHQPIRDWEGQPAHTYGEIAYSSVVTLCHTYTQERSDHFLVLFSFHLLILSVDHAHRDFVYKGILPLSGLTFRPVSWDADTSHPQDGFEISSAMVDPKVFLCPSAAEVSTWMDHLESTPRTVSPALGPLAYLGVQERRLMVLYPQDVLLLSVDNDMINLTYEPKKERPEWAGKTDAPPLPKLPRNGKKPQQHTPTTTTRSAQMDALLLETPTTAEVPPTYALETPTTTNVPPMSHPAPGDTHHRHDVPLVDILQTAAAVCPISHVF
ncbi:hypothetical protein CRUP_009251, partial [Coryphaenoides rupestris]